MSHILWQDFIFLAVLIGLSVPLGIYTDRVMAGKRVFLNRALAPVERGIYRLTGVQAEEEMGAKQYALSRNRLQRRRACVPLGVADVAGIFAAQPGGNGRDELAPCMEHSREFYLQHELAGLFGRIHAVVSDPGAGAYRAKLRVRRGGHCRAVCADPGADPQNEKRRWATSGWI